MRLRAEIIVDVDAADFVAAANHQTSIEAIVEDLRSRYGQVQLCFRQRRIKAEANTPTQPPAVRRPTGRQHAYEELDGDA
jgi:hypothetical protein